MFFLIFKQHKWNHVTQVLLSWTAQMANVDYQLNESYPNMEICYTKDKNSNKLYSGVST